MRKKALVLLLALTMVLSCMPMIAFADTEPDGTVQVNKTVKANGTGSEELVQDNVDEEGIEALADEVVIDGETAEKPADEISTDMESSNISSQQTVNDQEQNTLPNDDQKSYIDEITGCIDQTVKKTYENSSHSFSDVQSSDSGVVIAQLASSGMNSDNLYYTGEIEFHFVGQGTAEVTLYAGDVNAGTIKVVTDSHDWKSDYTVDIEPTCTEAGSKSIHCTRCGETKEAVVVPALGHDWNADYTVDIEPTCTEAGSKSIHCTRCGETKEAVVVPALGHDYDIDNDNMCKRCGEKCNHKHTKKAYDWDEKDPLVNCTKIDNKNHIVTGTVELVTYCNDCKSVVSSVPKSLKNEVLYHEYDSEGFCKKCSHTNTCKHPSTYFEYDYYPDECEIEDLGDGSHHKVKGVISEVTVCKVCEAIQETKELGNTSVTEIHYYNEDDVCKYCGCHNPKVRIFGNLRYDTAIKAADKYKATTGSKFKNVIVAYGRNFPDALSGGYLAKVKNAPILLVEPSVENRIADYISRNISPEGKVYILGGTGVVSDAFESKVIEKGISTERLGGETRYETNLSILEAAGVKAEDILVCTGTGFADSLSAAAVGKPILLVGNALTDTQKQFIMGLSSKQFYLIGGTGAVKTDVENDLKDMGFEPERLWGETRYETSTAVAKKFFEKAKTVVLAYALNFPDGLSGGPLAMLKDAPIVLTDSNTTAAAKDYVKSADIANSITLGGPALISDIAVKTIMGR